MPLSADADRDMPLPVDDALWQRIAPLLSPASAGGSALGRPPMPDRQALNGILWILTTGAPWNALPRELGYGSGTACWHRLRIWRVNGAWPRIHAEVLREWHARGCERSALALQRNWREREALNAQVARSRNASFGQAIELVIGFGGGFSESVARLLAAPIAEQLRIQVDVVSLNDYGARDGKGACAPMPLILGGPWIGGSPLGADRLLGGVDWAPVGPALAVPLALVTPAESRFETWFDLQRVAERDGRPLVCSTPPPGTGAHRCFEQLQRLTRWRLDPMIGSGGGEQAVSLAQGASDIAVMSMATAAPLLRRGIVRGVAFASRTRLAAFPDVPSVVELGYPALEKRAWLALHHPGETDDRLVQRIAREVNAAFRSYAVREFMTSIGARSEVIRAGRDRAPLHAASSPGPILGSRDALGQEIS